MEYIKPITDENNLLSDGRWRLKIAIDHVLFGTQSYDFFSCSHENCTIYLLELATRFKTIQMSQRCRDLHIVDKHSN